MCISKNFSSETFDLLLFQEKIVFESGKDIF